LGGASLPTTNLSGQVYANDAYVIEITNFDIANKFVSLRIIPGISATSTK
jgi:precorrin-3B methylase